MTLTEQEKKLADIRLYIADRFRDIQIQSNALKNVEDETKVLQTLAKISDFSADIRKNYEVLKQVMYEPIEEDDPYDIFDSLFDD